MFGDVTKLNNDVDGILEEDKKAFEHLTTEALIHEQLTNNNI